MRQLAAIALLVTLPLAGCTANQSGPVQVTESKASSCYLEVSIDDAENRTVRVQTSTDHKLAQNESTVPMVALADSWIAASWQAENGTTVGWNRTVNSDCSVGGAA